MTAICGMAMGKKPIPSSCDVHFATANFLLPSGQQQAEASKQSLGDGNNEGGASGMKLKKKTS
jgi:ATP citrate (pro-S)-lyase